MSDEETKAVPSEEPVEDKPAEDKAVEEQEEEEEESDVEEELEEIKALGPVQQVEVNGKIFFRSMLP